MKKYFLPTLLFFFILQISFAQNQWKQFQSPEQVNDLLETETHIWFATNAGIIQVRKNNLEKNYFNQSNSNLTHEHITAIEKDADGVIWATQENMTLVKLEGNEWTIIPLPSDYSSSNSASILNDLELDAEGNKWMGCTKGVVKFDGTDWEIFHYQNTNSNYLSNVFSIEIDGNNNLIAACITNVMFDGTEWVDQYPNPSQLFAYDKAELFCHSNGDIWYHNFGGAIGHWNGTDWIEYNSDSLFWNPSPPQEEFSNFLEDENGNILLTTAQEGIYKLENSVWEKQNINHPELFSKYGHAFYHIDNQGIKWFANQNTLLKEVDSDLTTGYFSDHTLQRNSVHLIKKDNNGKLFFTNGNIGNIATFSNGIWEELETPFDTFQYAVRPHDIEFTNNNEMWVGSSKGLFFKNQSGWTHFTPWTVFPASSTSSIELDADGNLWAGSNDGLIKYDGTEWTVFTPDNSPLHSVYINYLSMDHDGGLWLMSQATQNRKWYYFKNNEWEIFDANYPALLSGTAFSPFVDADNNVWFRTQSEGVIKYDGTSWEKINTSNSNLVDDRVTSIEQDKNGKIYIGTKSGISIFDGDVWENLEVQNTPLPDRKIYSMIHHDDVLWAGTDIYGLFAYNPNGFPTSIKNIETDFGFDILTFPNPTNDVLKVKFTLEKTTLVQFQILNLDGKVMKNFNFGKKGKGEYLENLEVGDLSSGAYFLKKQGERGTFKFLKF